MTLKEHQNRHKKLYASFDELLADFIQHTGKRPSETTVMELIEWSHSQTISPKK